MEEAYELPSSFCCTSMVSGISIFAPEGEWYTAAYVGSPEANAERKNTGVGVVITIYATDIRPGSTLH